MEKNLKEMEEQEEKLRSHIRNIPCFSCLVRPACIEFYNDGNAHVDTKKICDMFEKWGKKRDEIMDYGSRRSKIIMEEILEVLRKEKEEYVTDGKRGA